MPVTGSMDKTVNPVVPPLDKEPRKPRVKKVTPPVEEEEEVGQDEEEEVGQEEEEEVVQEEKKEVVPVEDEEVVVVQEEEEEEVVPENGKVGSKKTAEDNSEETVEEEVKSVEPVGKGKEEGSESKGPTIQYGPKLDSTNTDTALLDPAAARAEICRLLRVHPDHIGDGKYSPGWACVDQEWADKFLAIDWSKAFTQDGDLRLREVRGMLPKKSKNADLSLHYFYSRLKSTVIALADYNEKHKDAEYSLVRPIVICPCGGNKEYVNHTNFLARPKNPPNAPVELFFAVVGRTSMKVTDCGIVGPHLYPPGIQRPLENAKFSPKIVVHLEGMNCDQCNTDKRFI